MDTQSTSRTLGSVIVQIREYSSLKVSTQVGKMAKKAYWMLAFIGLNTGIRTSCYSWWWNYTWRIVCSTSCHHAVENQSNFRQIHNMRRNNLSPLVIVKMQWLTCIIHGFQSEEGEAQLKTMHGLGPGSPLSVSKWNTGVVGRYDWIGLESKAPQINVSISNRSMRKYLASAGHQWRLKIFPQLSRLHYFQHSPYTSHVLWVITQGWH